MLDGKITRGALALWPLSLGIGNTLKQKRYLRSQKRRVKAMSYCDLHLKQDSHDDPCPECIAEANKKAYTRTEGEFEALEDALKDAIVDLRTCLMQGIFSSSFEEMIEKSIEEYENVITGDDDE